MMKQSQTNKGFTLIELLIVIAIIGVLATLIMTNFVGVRQRARDSQRKANLLQLQSALELYRSDQGEYPIRNTTYRLNDGTACPTSQALESGTTEYISEVPCDPLGASGFNTGNYYYYSLDGSEYVMAACLENENDNDPKTDTTPPSPSGGTCSTGKFFIVTNP